ncbi:MAG: hypothetical protein ACSHXK_02835, partial [Oceanococcus sp.]
PISYRHDIRLLRGHQPFGLHTYLSPGARYLTVLRDPIARVVSHYFYVKRHRHPKFIGAIEAQNMSLKEYAQSRMSGELENGQTRWIAGVLDDRPLGQDDLDQALRNIDQYFDWIGLTEKFDYSLIDLALKYYWPKVYYSRKNVSTGDVDHHVDPAAIEVIRQNNLFDLQLYQYVAEKTRKSSVRELVVRSMGGVAMQCANALYQWYKKELGKTRGH